MKLNVAVNEVTLSTTGAIGEFRIRNSAKAFKILSDGLYSNKIKAIIRELSCNALDSHVAAGKASVPFEVHLPSLFEPWFSVRDYGIGLNDNQVRNIYTTYFESTKTDSNNFIGALGLGSKSPFSYTENFTVTAIKDGVRRIYSAFINDHGVPSIALMDEAETMPEEVNGVEVKFSVVEKYDYSSFKLQANEVFKWFKYKPIITGVSSAPVDEVEYKEKNIVPGVHLLPEVRNENAIALMGNIPYPLNNIPEKEKHFDKLSAFLDCGLVLEFDIGELDFAASREQLSYIPMTIANIRKKLELLNANLYTHLKTNADAISELWERAFYLQEQSSNKLYNSVVKKYILDTKFPLLNPDYHRVTGTLKCIKDDLTKMGLDISGFHAGYYKTSRVYEDSEYVNNKYVASIRIPVEKDVIIVLNDLKTGCVARARHHFSGGGERKIVFCISHNSPDMAARQVVYDQFTKDLYNPPIIMKASELSKPIRNTPLSSQGIMALELKKSYGRHRYQREYTWTPYTETIDDNLNYVFVYMSNYDSIDEHGTSLDIYSLRKLLDNCGIDSLSNIKIYGVRKSRIDEFKDLPNWLWIGDVLKQEISKISDNDISSMVAANLLDSYGRILYTNKNVAKIVGPDSDYAKYVAKYGDLKKTTNDISSLVALCSNYGKVVQVDAVRKIAEQDKKKLQDKYPLMEYITNASEERIVEYIQMVDKQEKN